jgi:GNAT superfamily N-acetyltransferase
MHVEMRRAAAADADLVSSILHEAAAWLRGRGDPLWAEDEIAPEVIAGEVAAGLYFLAERDGEVAGTLRFQLTDPEFWPDAGEGESAFVHRLAVRRAFAGRGVSTAMLRWAADRARGLGRVYLRLDCEVDRPALRRMYEEFGFRYHSDRRFERFSVARYELPLGEAGGSIHRTTSTA